MPDFGIFRGFNDKLFGNKLYAGQLPTQLGTIGSVSVGFDIDAIAFFDRVTTAGGILSTLEKDAINQLVLDMKFYSIWSNMKAIYPMVGASSAACAQNLKSSSFTGTFNGGWTFASTGVKGNGINSEFVSNFSLNNFSSKLSVAFGMYSRTNISGAGVGMTAKNNVEFYSNYTLFNQNYSYLFDSNNNSTTISSYLGLNSHSRTSSSQKFLQKRTSITSFTSNVNATDLDSSIVIFSKTGQGFDSNEYALYYISDGLTDTQLLNFNNIVNTFQTTLNRNV